MSKDPDVIFIAELIAKIKRSGKSRPYSLTGEEMLSIIKVSATYGYSDGFAEALKAFSAFDGLDSQDIIKDLHATRAMKNLNMTPEEYVGFLTNSRKILLKYHNIFKEIKSLDKQVTFLA